MTVRAKFRCIKAEYSSYGPAVKYTFMPMYDTSVPEDQRYAKATPSGELWMLVDNPAVKFEMSGDYYLDVTPVPVPEPAADA